MILCIFKIVILNILLDLLQTIPQPSPSIFTISIEEMKVTKSWRGYNTINRERHRVRFLRRERLGFGNLASDCRLVDEERVLYCHFKGKLAFQGSQCLASHNALTLLEDSKISVGISFLISLLDFNRLLLFVLPYPCFLSCFML